MSTVTVDSHVETIQGSIERVTFHSEESGFCVLRVKVKGHRDLVTVVGSAASVSPGEFIECQGHWHNDKKHGLQFSTQHLTVIPPTTLEGIEKYLGSGMIKGIGPHFAKKLVRAFGTNVFDIIETEPHRLVGLEGIGQKRKDQVIAAWHEQKEIRNIMVFLQSYGVGTARSVRIYKAYGNEAIDKVRENPYRLALDIWGIGFKTADALAEKLGVPRDSLQRAQAGALHVLQELCDSGHCAAVQDDLVAASSKLLEIVPERIIQAIQLAIQEEQLVEDVIQNKICLYPKAFYMAEMSAAKHIQRLKNGMPPWGAIDIDKAIPWIEKKANIQLSPSQQAAIRDVVGAKLAIITGGPGVGKTTLINSFLRIIRTRALRIALAAPTGRAAKRLSESTRLTAKTIHRLLEFDPKKFGFKYNQDNLLPIDVLIIDESSMLDILLFNQLLKAVPTQAAVIFVGDVDQLPSVGSGQVLSDLIKSESLLTVRLTEVFRQAACSKIILNAHRINQGSMPLANDGRDSDFFTIYLDTPEAMHTELLDLICVRLPRFYRCDPRHDIQVLTPMNRGGLGSQGLNQALQERLNGKATPRITRFGTTFAPGDKVIQRVNNYDKEVFNGDIGFIEQIDEDAGIVQIHFDNTLKAYEMHELDELSLAYAISIHKSQGSEFPIVVLPIAMQHFTLLARNLLYTGITRGRKLVVLIGQKKAVGMAIHNDKALNRLTKLAERLSK